MNAGASLARKCEIFSGLSEKSEEHALVVFKPDFDYSYYKTFIELCEKAGLTIDRDGGEVLLPPEKHDHLFLDCATNYKNYLNSGPVRPLLLRGPFACQRFSSIKSAVRIQKDMHVSSLTNMLHAADDGIEFQRQVEFFFPDQEILSHADMAIDWKPGQLAIGKELEKRMVRCRWIGLIIDYADLPEFRDSFREVDLGNHSCLLGIRIQAKDLSIVVFPSPFNYDLFFDTPAERQLADIVLKQYGIASLEVPLTIKADAEEMRDLHFTQLGDHLEDVAANLELEMRARAPNDGRGVIALRVMSPADSYTSADIARRCAARLGWRKWGGSGTYAQPDWRLTSRGEFERLVYSMPEL